MTTDMIRSSDIAVPTTRTSVYEAIFGRRMTKEFTGAEVPQDALARMLDAAVWAPNHRLTEAERISQRSILAKVVLGAACMRLRRRTHTEQGSMWYPCPDSNRGTRFRKPMLYPPELQGHL